VRLRPILLTASAAMLGAVPIIIDPIFSGLAWSLIFGLFASTLFTLFVIPVAYWLLYANKPGHGLPQATMEEEAKPTELEMNRLGKEESIGRLEQPGFAERRSKMDSGKPPNALGIVLSLLSIPLVFGGTGFFFYNLFFGRDVSFLNDPGSIFIFLALMIPGGILALIALRLLRTQ
jgi:hypothetical protein